MHLYRICDRFGFLAEDEYPNDQAASAVGYGYASRCPSASPYYVYRHDNGTLVTVARHDPVEEREDLESRLKMYDLYW